MGGFQASYFAGDWVGIAGDRTWVIVESESISPTIGELWNALKVFRDPLDFIDVITAYGIRNTPSFAFASVAQNEIWIVVRGRARAKAVRGGETFELDSNDSQTWQEYRFEDNLEDIQLIGDLLELSSSFPLSAGVVRAAVLSIATSTLIAPVEALSPSSSAVNAKIDEKSDSYSVENPSSSSTDTTDAVEDAPVSVSDSEFDEANAKIDDKSDSYSVENPSSSSTDTTDAAEDASVSVSDSEFDEANAKIDEQSDSYSVENPSSSSTDTTDAGEDVPVSVSDSEFDEDEHDEYREALFGATIDRSVEGAAIREAAAHILETGGEEELASGNEADRQSLEQNDFDSTLSEFTPPSNEDVFEEQIVDNELIDSIPFFNLGLVPESTPPTSVKRTPLEVKHVGGSRFGNLEFVSDDFVSEKADPTTTRRADIIAIINSSDSGFDPSSSPMVQAARCPRGHLNPAHAVICRICRNEIISQESFTVARPELGYLTMSTGGRIKLDRSVLMGRSPSLDRYLGSETPHLVKVPSPTNDISRNHLEVSLDGWQVRVIDLNSKNGTIIRLPGREVERLRPDVASIIEPGTFVMLSDDVSFTFEVTE